MRLVFSTLARRRLIWVSTLTLAGCSLPPNAHESRQSVPPAFKEATAPAPALPAGWKVAEPGGATERGAWWHAFRDPQLDAFEEQAARANPGLGAAAARVKAARAALQGAEAQRWPVLGLRASASQARGAGLSSMPAVDEGTPKTTAWSMGLGASYEADLFGGVESRIDAATAMAKGSQASYLSMLLILQADVAHAYFSLRTIDAEIVLLNANLGLRREIAQLVGKRFAAGDVTEVDMARSQTELALGSAEVEALFGERAKVEHALALLLGLSPAEFELAPAPLSLESPVPNVPAGLPSALLERRPDIAAAQLRLQAATAQVGAARAALFPALTLTLEGGYSSSELERLFKLGSGTWLASLVMSLPLIDGGRNGAVVQSAEAGLEGAVHEYRSTVLDAFAEVEDSLVSLKAVQEQAVHIERAALTAQRASALAEIRYRAGEDSYQQLIDAQRDLLTIQHRAIALRGQWRTATVRLIRCLGGGWAPL